jgi:ABC-type nitrate/sulfonate/bicarbonate transport system ATPase subunit
MASTCASTEGEFVCLVGQTGCGKSTLLRLVLGSEQPLTGRVLIDGVEHHQPDRTRGYVPQKYSLFPDKTVLDNITFGPEVSEFSLLGHLTPRFYRRRRELRGEACDYLRRIGLTRIRRRQVSRAALRGHAAACGDRPGAHHEAPYFIDGRGL